MKILYVAPTPTMYGDNVALLKVIPYLINRGVKPHFIVSRRGVFTDELEKRGYNYTILMIRSCMYPPLKTIKDFLLFLPRMLKNNIVNFFSFKKLLVIAEYFAPDVIHSNLSTIDIGFRVARRLKIPHVWHVREFGKLDKGCEYFPSKGSFERKLSNSNNYSIFITKNVKDYFSITNSYSIIYDGIFSQPNIIGSQDKRLNQFLYVGRLNKSKGIDMLIDAYGDFCKEIQGLTNIFKLVIVGEFEDNGFKKKIQQKIVDYQLEKNVEFLGYRKDVYDLMRESKVLIVTSVFEAFGFITAEGMYNGCLLVARNTGGTKEQLDNIYNISKEDVGFRFDTRAELKEQLIKIAKSDFKDYSNMISNANQIAYQLYSIQRSSEEIHNIYLKTYES